MEEVANLQKKASLVELPKDKRDKFVSYLPNIKIGNVELTKIVEEQLDKDKIEKLTNGITDEKELAEITRNIANNEILNNTKIADVFEKVLSELKVNKELFSKMEELNTILKNN